MMKNRNRNIGIGEASLVDKTIVKIRFSEVDSMHVVWHGAYVKYLEDGRESFGQTYSGLGYSDFLSEGISAPIVDLQMQYIAPLKLNDVIEIETRYMDSPAAKICFEYIIRKVNDSQIVVKASTVQVLMNENGKMFLNPPTFIKQWKNRWLTNR